jgi:hypothetical protein
MFGHFIWNKIWLYILRISILSRFPLGYPYIFCLYFIL